jgi:hypothetical protein
MDCRVKPGNDRIEKQKWPDMPGHFIFNGGEGITPAK